MSKFAPEDPPLVVTLVDDSELAVAGLRVLLEPFAPRVTLVDDREAVARPDAVDVVLYEPRARSGVADSRRASLMDGGAGVAVAFTWEVPVGGTPEAAVCLPKTLAASQLVVALEEVVAGRHPGLAAAAAPVPEPTPARHDKADPVVERLTTREHEVLSLIAAGLPNRDIANRLELSLNSVKTYIRTAYRKIGAERRTQAVLWGLEHGLVPEPDGVAAGS